MKFLKKPIFYGVVFLIFSSCGQNGQNTPKAGVKSNDGTPEGREIEAIMKQVFNYDEAFSIADQGFIHYVKQGETVNMMAKKFGIDPEELMAINDIQDPRTLQIGTRIYIPNVPEKVYQAVNTPAEKDKKTPVKENSAVPEKSAAPVPAKSPIDSQPQPKKANPGAFGNLCWPVSGGQISSRFGERWGKNHEGIDLPGPVGAPVRAAADGEVILSTFNEGGYGNLIIIMHNNENYTIYAHNKVNLVKKGDKVKRCQKIAELGSTGRSTGPHCHFEVREKKIPRNPLLFMEH